MPRLLSGSILVLTILTLGLWVFVWLGVIGFDEWGNTNIQNL